jgi:tRNA nucleotidyltransferase (CCA-adding enzyme)
MSDYNFLMESRLSPEQYQVLTHITRMAVEHGLNIYLAGGAVRDLTYGFEMVHDLDFAVEGNPQRILRALEAGRPPAVSPLAVRPAETTSVPRVAYWDFDSRTNAAELHFSNGVRAEIAMCRTEVYRRPGKRPEVAPAMIFDDLRRRDFSVNAMAVSLHPNSRGLLLDPTNGAADIERHELRVLHNRSFSDDPIRIYRLLRLASRMGFKPAEKSEGLLAAALDAKVWANLDPSLQGRELQAILREDNPGKVLKNLSERGLVAGLDRKLAAARIPSDRFARIRELAPTVPGADGFLLNFHNAVSKLSRGHQSRLAEKIIGNRKLAQIALNLEREAKRLARVVGSSKFALPSRAVKLLSGEPPTLLLFLLVHYPQPKIQNRVKAFLHKYPLVRARMPRAEFQAMGAKPGNKFEKILEQLFFDQIDGKIKTPQQLAKQFRKLAGIPEPPPPKPPKKEKVAKPAKAAKQEEDKARKPLPVKVTKPEKTGGTTTKAKAAKHKSHKNSGKK